MRPRPHTGAPLDQARGPHEHVDVVGSAADHPLRDFLTRIAQPYEWLDGSTGQRLLVQLGRSSEELPVIVIDGDLVLVRPTLEEVADALGLRSPPSKADYDVVIVGAGPAGLAAAVYAAADGLSVAVVEQDAPGGQASYTSQIENYFGIDPNGPPRARPSGSPVQSERALRPFR